MRFDSRKRNAIIIAIAVVVLGVGLVLAYSMGTKSSPQEEDDASIADSSIEQVIKPSADISDEDTVIPDDAAGAALFETETSIEPQTEEEIPDDSLQYIAWQFFTYEAPDFTTATLASLPPGNVQVVQRLEDGWAQIEAGSGTSWVYTEKNLYYIDRWVSLYSDIDDENELEDLPPQIVEIIEQKDGWFHIRTEFGDGWVDPYSVRRAVRLEVPSYNQMELGYPLGCELVSLAMMMNYKRDVDVGDLYIDLPRADHPDEGFRGDPATSTRGWTIFPPALAGMMVKYMGSSYDMSNLEMEDLKEQLNTNTPILVWIKGLGWPVHALCLTGYDETGFFYNDPATGEKDVPISYEEFYTIWNDPIYDRVLDLTYAPRKALSYYS